CAAASRDCTSCRRGRASLRAAAGKRRSLRRPAPGSSDAMPREACPANRSSCPPNPLARSASRCHHAGGMGAATSNDAAQANRLGLEALRSGDAKAAVGHFEAACRGDLGAAELRINLAMAYRLQGNDTAERRALEQVLDIDRLNLMAEIRLAQLHE